MTEAGSSDGAEFRQAWTVVVAAAVGVGLGITGLPIYTTGQFILPLQAAFGWSRAAISGGLLCLTVVNVVTAPLVGVLTERFGVRRVGMAAMLGLAAGYGGLALSTGSIAGFYAGWAVLGVLGAGTSPIVWTKAVASWFDRQRGLALGLALCGTGVVAMIGPGLIGTVIADHGWRAGFWTLAAAPVVVGLPVAFFLLQAREPRHSADPPGGVAARDTLAAERSSGSVAGRHRPDGAGPDGAGSNGVGPDQPDGQSLRVAAHGRRFWQMIAAFALIAIVVGGTIVHLPAMLAEAGTTGARSSNALELLGVAIIAGRLGIGVLVDRLPVRLVAPCFILLPVLSCLLLARGDGSAAAVIALGLSAGAEVDLLAFLVSRYFGMRHYARIYGWMLAAFSAGVGVGPVFAGWVHDRFNGYRPALAAFVACVAVAAVLVAGLGPDREAVRAAGASP